MKTKNILLTLTALIALPLTFVNCSKDDDDNGGDKKSNSLIGGWICDDSGDYDKDYYIFEEDGTVLAIEINYPDDPDPKVDIRLYDWKNSKGQLTCNRGACKEVVNFFISSNGEKLSITDEDNDSETFTRLTDAELQAIRKKLNIDPDLVGFWQQEGTSTYVELDPDGYGTQLHNNFTSIKWEAKDGTVSFQTFGGATAKNKYTVADDKNSFMFGSLKYVRVAEDQYKDLFNDYVKKNDFLGAWENENPWAADPTSSILSPAYRNNYIVFNSDGTFKVIALKAKDSKGATITDIKKYDGKWQFDRSLFTFTIDNNESADAVPWQLTKESLRCGLPFIAPLVTYDKYWAYGKFVKIDMSYVEPYL